MADTANRKTKGLGRGLSALLAETGGDATDVTTRPDFTVPVEHVAPNPEQPRRSFNQQELEELAESIRARGIVQPLIVRPSQAVEGAKYQIVAGERRWRAAQIARLHEVPVIVRDYSDADALEIALLENIQRSDLNPIEEARALKQLMQRFGHSQEELARQLGKSRSHLANTMRLLNLPDDVITHVEQGRLSAGHARSLLTAENASQLADRIVAEGLSVRAVEGLVKRQNDPKPSSKAPAAAPKANAKDDDTIALERDLSAATGLKVTIDWDRNSGKGKVQLGFEALEQLDWICARLG